MRTPKQMRETTFIVARQNRAGGLDDVRPMPASCQIHFDVLDLLAALAEKDAEIEALKVEIDERDTWSEQRARDAWKDHKNASRIIDDLKADLKEQTKLADARWVQIL